MSKSERPQVKGRKRGSVGNANTGGRYPDTGRVSYAGEASDTELVQNVQNNDARTEFVPALRTMATRQSNKLATRASVFSRAAVHPWPLDPRETTVMTAFTPYEGAY